MLIIVGGASSGLTGVLCILFSFAMIGWIVAAQKKKIDRLPKQSEAQGKIIIVRVVVSWPPSTKDFLRVELETEYGVGPFSDSVQ